MTGKGGVGKSTVSAALGLRSAADGHRTVVAEVGERDDVARTLAADADGRLPTGEEADGESGRARPFVERELRPDLFHVTITPEAALREYLRDQLPLGPFAGALASSRAFTALTAATPGMGELLTTGKVWELGQAERRTPGATPYARVVLDAPATGHGVALLEAPGTFAEMARVGPVARQGRVIADDLTDPARVAVVVVTTAEDLAVGETVELHAALRERLGLVPALTVVNGVLPDRLSARDLEVLEQSPSRDPAVGVARLHGRRAREQRRQLARLRRAIDGPVATLPFRGDARLGADAVGALAERLRRHTGDEDAT